jgi:hypothetical protein
VGLAKVSAVDERIPQGFGSEHTPGLLAALVALQAELPKLPKDKTNPHFKSKFTGLDTIIDAVGPLLAKHGLTWMTLPGRDALGPHLEYRLVYVRTGEVIDGTIPLLLAKDDMQGLGSALTYGRRYALTCVLNLVSDEDDDGAAASSYGSPPPPGTVSLQKFAKGLSTDQIRAAFQQVGANVSGTPYQALDRVPEEKAQALYAALQAAQHAGQQ